MKAWQTAPLTLEEIQSLWVAHNSYRPQGTKSVVRRASEAFKQIDELLDDKQEELTKVGAMAAQNGLLLDDEMHRTHRLALKAAFEKGIWSSRWCAHGCDIDDKLEHAEEVKVEAVKDKAKKGAA